MKAFHFTLQEILDYRLSLKEIAQNDLGAALAKEKLIQDKIDSLMARSEELKKSLSGGTDFIEITRAQEYYAYARSKTEELKGDLKAAKLISDEKREALKLAMQKVSSLEKVKETQLSEWKVAAAREEDNTLDDLITSRQ